jgi:uncharacterized protein
MSTAALLKDGRVLIPDVRFCVRLGERMKGLLGTRELGEGRAVFLAPCSAIHTFFMRMDLDIVFLRRDLRVARIVRGVVPNRMASVGLGAWGVVEMQAGWFPADALHEGDAVSFRPVTATTGPGGAE